MGAPVDAAAGAQLELELELPFAETETATKESNAKVFIIDKVVNSQIV